MARMHRREWYEKGECFDASKIEKHKKKSENGRMIGSGERSIQILQLLQMLYTVSGGNSLKWDVTLGRKQR